MSIYTVTLNPALDKSTVSPVLVADNKLRCSDPVYHPGGGGINVARVLHRFNTEHLAIFQSSGPSGDMIEKLLKEEEVDFLSFETENWTRENFVVVDDSTGLQYRFGMNGPEFNEDEVEMCFELITNLEELPEILVLSGSLPPGVPVNFYADVVKWAKTKGIKVIVDTNGDALDAALEEGVLLIKPNIKELSDMAGKEHVTGKEQEEVALSIVESGNSEYVIVSLGARGAMIASKEGIEYVTTPTVEQKSTVGAGDSMVAGMCYAISEGMSPRDILRYGVACGTAAVMNTGSKLCTITDVNTLLELIE